jgi:hypothetical protein
MLQGVDTTFFDFLLSEMAQQGNVWLETQLSGATARSYIIF